ncbi:hypothetical protein KFK09_009625 [Dendrobium nobile]|uniref:Secreted protein n=1 Tax=Dendrobium nobile TaxID=94219 RepID=A0A8T3BKA4_DENNO|nr:hypothetical protein KFK09_009625 [Dendrobium nobile]
MFLLCSVFCFGSQAIAGPFSSFHFVLMQNSGSFSLLDWLVTGCFFPGYCESGGRLDLVYCSLRPGWELDLFLYLELELDWVFYGHPLLMSHFCLLILWILGCFNNC